MLQYCNMYDHDHVPTLHTRGSSRLFAARVDWMSMSSLNFCVIASEICLTLDNIGCTDITLEAAKAHLQDDELKEVEGEELAGWADNTLRKHPVLLNINHFFPQFMNLNLQKLTEGSLDPTLANKDLMFDPGQALQVRQWFFNPDTPIIPGFAKVEEKDFHRSIGPGRERFQNETLPHLIHFLNVLGRKNKLLIESFMQLVPKDIASALGQCFCGAKIISFEEWPSCPDGCDSSGLTEEQDNPDEALDSNCECPHHRRLLKRKPKRKRVSR